jgi:hypothetical protein
MRPTTWDVVTGCKLLEDSGLLDGLWSEKWHLIEFRVELSA